MGRAFCEVNNCQEKPNELNFSEIWYEFGSVVRAYIEKRVPHEQDAEDILQEVFLRVYRSIAKLKDSKRLQAWVYQIARNAVVAYYRSSGKVDEIEFREEMVGTTDEYGATANEEIAGCLRAMVDCMPDKYKQAIITTQFADQTQRALAEQEGLSLSGAKSRVQRGRLILKEMLLDCCSLEFDCYGNVVEYKHKKKACEFC